MIDWYYKSNQYNPYCTPTGNYFPLILELLLHFIHSIKNKSLNHLLISSLNMSQKLLILSISSKVSFHINPISLACLIIHTLLCNRKLYFFGWIKHNQLLMLKKIKSRQYIDTNCLKIMFFFIGLHLKKEQMAFCQFTIY